MPCVCQDDVLCPRCLWQPPVLGVTTALASESWWIPQSHKPYSPPFLSPEWGMYLDAHLRSLTLELTAHTQGYTMLGVPWAGRRAPSLVEISWHSLNGALSPVSSHFFLTREGSRFKNSLHGLWAHLLSKWEHPILRFSWGVGRKTTG